MKAANLKAIGDLVVEELKIPEPADDEVLVKVECCGICGSDIPRVFTKGTYNFPTVIGHEFSGCVIEDKSGEYTGQRVAVFPLLPCFECDSCKAENYAACRSYNYYGSRCNGGLAEYLAVKKWNLVKLPDNISYEEGAMCEPISVARHAVLKLQLSKGDNLLVSGAGPIGLLAGQWAKMFGAGDVYYFDIDESKIEFAKTLGFKAFDDNAQIDAVIEGTGHSAAIETCLKAIKPFGKIVLMGNPVSDVLMSQNTYWHILRKELVVLGTWNSSYNDRQNDWKESLNALSLGKLNAKVLISHRFPLSKVCEAMEMMKNREEFYNKVMIYNNEEAL